MSQETGKYVASIAIELHFNLPLAPWRGGFFEPLIRTIKLLLITQLNTYRLNYEKMQTVLQEIEL